MVFKGAEQYSLERPSVLQEALREVREQEERSGRAATSDDVDSAVRNHALKRANKPKPIRTQRLLDPFA